MRTTYRSARPRRTQPRQPSRRPPRPRSGSAFSGRWRSTGRPVQRPDRHPARSSPTSPAGTIPSKDTASSALSVPHPAVRTNNSRARKALGVDDEGRPHMPEAEHGTFRLGPGITTDWHRFQHLTALARHAPSGDAIEHYREAMNLIRGAPFAEHPKGSYHWIHGDGLYFAIETGVAEAAEHFAELLLDEGEHRLA